MAVKQRDRLAVMAQLQDRAAAAGYELSFTAEADRTWTYGLETRQFKGLAAHVGGGATLDICLAAAEMALIRLPERRRP